MADVAAVCGFLSLLRFKYLMMTFFGPEKGRNAKNPLFYLFFKI